MNSVVAVVVTYNRKKMLLRCIQALMVQEYPCDIILVDNGSNDGTRDYIREYMSNSSICYYNTGENLGGSGGFRVGIELAVQKGYDYVWIMDDDTLPCPDALAELIKADRCLNGRYGFLSGVAYWTDGNLCNMNVQRIGLHKKVKNYDTISPIIMATFVSFFVKAEIIKQVGLPIKEFFIWADDLEYSRRISRLQSCYMVPSSKVIHCMTDNGKVGIVEENADRLWRYNYLYRNEFFVFKREGCKGYLYMLGRVTIHLYRILLYAKAGRIKKIKTVCKSFWKGFSFCPKIEYVSEKEGN